MPNTNGPFLTVSPLGSQMKCSVTEIVLSVDIEQVVLVDVDQCFHTLTHTQHHHQHQQLSSLIILAAPVTSRQFHATAATIVFNFCLNHPVPRVSLCQTRSLQVCGATRWASDLRQRLNSGG